MSTLGTGRRAYGGLARWLHWVTVLALVAQLVVGYLVDAETSGRGRGRGRGGESGRGRGRGGDDESGEWAVELGWNLVTAHISLGVLIVLLAAARIAWRRHAGLPPWAESLTLGEQRLATVTERALLTLLFVVPVTGIVLIASGDDDVLPLHVAGHVALYVAVAAHVGLVLRRRLLPRML